jgi:hypothetical protein
LGVFENKGNRKATEKLNYEHPFRKRLCPSAKTLTKRFAVNN